MTREEAKDYIREWCPYDRQEEIIKTLEQEPCSNCCNGNQIEKIILQLPSVNQLNKWIGAEVIDDIRNEMHTTAEKHEDGVYYLRDEWIDEIIDKYAEGSDKA